MKRFEIGDFSYHQTLPASINKIEHMRIKHKIFLLLVLSIFCNPSFSQTIIQELTKSGKTMSDIEMLLELEESFHKVQDSVKVDFNHADTLYIIRGLDIQSREGYGYIWNKSLKVSYTDNKIWAQSTLKSSNPRIVFKTDNITWHEFDNLIPLIEKWDTIAINCYVENCDKVLSGITSWSILRFTKKQKYYNLDILFVRDFGLCKKSKNASM